MMGRSGKGRANSSHFCPLGVCLEVGGGGGSDMDRP